MDPLTPLPRRSSRPWPGEPALRVGDAERATACDALAEHFAAGRLDPAELDDRLARAMGARSAAELAVLFRDLEPRRRPAAPERDPAPEPVAEVGAAVPLLVSLMLLALLVAGGMLMALGVYSFGFFVAALVGGTATAVAGGCAVAVAGRTFRRR